MFNIGKHTITYIDTEEGYVLEICKAKQVTEVVAVDLVDMEKQLLELGYNSAFVKKIIRLIFISSTQ